MENWFKGLKDSVVYPLKDANWLAKSWPLLVIALIPVISIVAAVLFKGWRLSAIRARIDGDNQLPELQLGAFFKQGLILWAFTFAYVLVPMSINWLILLTTSGWLSALLSLIIFTVWVFISLPVYQAGLVRYAVNGSWKSMFDVPANIVFLIKHIQQFIMFFISWTVIVFLIGVASYFLSVTVIGIPLIPVVILTVYYVSTAHELGGLARKIVAKTNGTVEFNQPDTLQIEN